MKINLYDVFTEPFKIVGKNPVILIPMFIGIIVSIIFEIVGYLGPIASFVTTLIIGIFSMFFFTWTTIMFDDYKNGKEVSLKESYSKMSSLFLEILVLSIVVGFLISLGFLAFVIPGIIISLFLIFSPCSLVVDNLSVTDSMKRSFSFVFNGDHFFQILIVLFAIFLLGLIPYVGVFISLILEFLMLPYIYVTYSEK